MRIKKRTFTLLGALFMISIFIYYQYEMFTMANDKKVSTDITALKNIISFKIPSTQLKWETFGTPEYTGGVPGPTDYITLISEIKLDNDEWFNKLKNTNDVLYLVPESARPWLSKPFKTTIEQHLHSGLDLEKLPNCKSYKTNRKNGQPVYGFTCLQNDSLLLYLTLVKPFQ